MVKYQLTNLAVQDLTDIWSYTFDNWSEQKADNYHEQLVNTFQSIANNPNIGRKFDGVRKELFGTKVNRHIVFYRVKTKEQVEITRILHERMDLKNRLK